MSSSPAPTRVRYSIISATTLAAFLMYLDRVFLSKIVASDSFRQDFNLTEVQTGYLLSAFFFAYAIGQMPAGWLSDRFGTRALMTWYVALWSACTALTGFATNWFTLLLSRAGCGLAEAGAYPTSGSLLARWASVRSRGVASSIVAIGGRLGGATAPALTTFVILHLGNWRWAGWVYGAAGIAGAWWFWTVFRERPAEHPRCNDAERLLIDEGRPHAAPVAFTPVKFPIAAVLRNTALWMMCVCQFTTNVGWVFLITDMPNYLKDVKHLSEAQSGFMASAALMIGVAGVFCGGVLTDLCSQKFGVRLGRTIPIASTRFLAAGAYSAALWLESPWALVLAFGVVAFATDLGVPAAWAYMQDVGGRTVGPIFGWANMWGNFGAALAPTAFRWVNSTFDANRDWHEALWFCAGAFALSGVCALFLDAARVVDESP